MLNNVPQHLPRRLLGSQSVQLEVEVEISIPKVEGFSQESMLSCQRRKTVVFRFQNNHYHQNNDPIKQDQKVVYVALVAYAT